MTSLKEQESIDVLEDPIELAMTLGREHALKPDQQAELTRRRWMKALHQHRLRLTRFLPEYVAAFRRAHTRSHGP